MIKKEEYALHYLNFNSVPYGMTVPDNSISIKHWHRQTEAIYADNCKLDVYAGGNVYNLVSGEMLFISGGVVHFYMKKQGTGNPVVLKFSNNYIVHSCFSGGNREKILKLYGKIFVVKVTDSIKKILLQIQNADLGEYNECYVAAKLLELTVYLLCNPGLLYNETKANIVENAKNLKDALDFMNENIGKKVTLEMLSNHLGFSTSYCSKYIKKKTGMTFIECMNSLRIGLAESLLIDSDYSITEIAFISGFASVQRFNKVFRHIKNMNPTQYRRYLKQGYPPTL